MQNQHEQICHSSINKCLPQVTKVLNKEERNQFVMAFPNWIARFAPDIFLSPQHNLQKEGKKDRLIFDAKLMVAPTAIPINLMTSTHEGVELQCEFGHTWHNILKRVWNLRISYPHSDIVIHANDVKSCFRQIKHHPDVAGAFCFVVSDYLYAQFGLSFGADFSPPIWEICRRMAEQMAAKLFDDTTLVDKHAKYLSQLQWGKKLGKKTDFVQAVACSKHQGVLDEQGRAPPTPHHYFVDDGLYAEVFDKPRILQATAASIETIFLLLGESALHNRQDPISWDKLFEMLINYSNVALGNHINTRKMIVF